MSEQQEWTRWDLVNELHALSRQLAAHKAALAAEQEEIKHQHEGWVRADKTTTIIYHENEKLKQQLAAVTKQRDDFRRALEERVCELDELREQLNFAVLKLVK
jgi:hypothetical protein